MATITRILCPVDFSDFSRRALEHAATMARWYGAELTALYVHHVPLAAMAPLGGLGAAPFEPLPLGPEDRRQLQTQLESFVSRMAGGVTVQCQVAEGDIVSEILAAASSAHMLVMGTHGRSGFEHLVLGSVTEKVLRKVGCPLLTIPQAATASKAVPGLFHHIVAAVDFSPASMRALKLASSLAKEADAHLTVLHVVDLPPDPTLWMDRPDGGSHVREFEDAALQRLKAAVPGSVREGCHVDEVVAAGQPYRAILKVAAEKHAGLIVIGAHGHGVVERMFLGSTAQHIVRQASCPVLTIRQD